MWGTYKPQLVHAVVNKSHTPTTLGFMYFNPDSLLEQKDLRYKVCDRPFDNIIYDYTMHNLYDFAVQRIEDPHVNINMTNNFIKIVKSSINRQQWVDITQNTLPQTSHTNKISIIYMIGLEDFTANPSVNKRQLIISSPGKDKI